MFRATTNPLLYGVPNFLKSVEYAMYTDPANYAKGAARQGLRWVKGTVSEALNPKP